MLSHLTVRTGIFQVLALQIRRQLLPVMVLYLVLVGLTTQACTPHIPLSTAHVIVKDPFALVTSRLPAERISVGIDEDYKPCITKLPSGELLLVAFHAPSQGGVPKEYNVLYRSSDGGQNWSQRQKLDMLGREPYLSVISDGTLFVSTHLLPAARGNREGYTQSYLYRSTDQGNTWEAIRIGFEDLKGVGKKSAVFTGRNVLELRSGILVFGVGGPHGYEFLWRSEDQGKSWDKSRACLFQGVHQEDLPFPVLGEAFLWQSPCQDLLAVCRITPKFFPPVEGTEIPQNKIDHYERMVLYRSKDGGHKWTIEEIGSYYGEMYPAILPLLDGRLLFTFTVRAAVAPARPPIGVQAVLGRQTSEGFRFDFKNDRIVLDNKTPVGALSGGGFGPTVQLDDGMLVTSYSYRSADQKTHLEVVRWRLPDRRDDCRLDAASER